MVNLKVVDGGLEETIHAHVDREDIFDDQLSRIRYGSLGSCDAQAKTHAVLVLHQLHHVALTHGTVTYLVSHSLSMALFDLIEVKIATCFIKLRIKLLVQLCIFNGAFVELFLYAFADCFVGNIVELSNQDVVDVLLSVLAHKSVDGGDLVLEYDDRIHQGGTYLLITDLPDIDLVLVYLRIYLLDLLIN